MLQCAYFIGTEIVSCSIWWTNFTNEAMKGPCVIGPFHLQVRKKMKFSFFLCYLINSSAQFF